MKYGLPHDDVLWLSSILSKKKLSKKELREERKRTRSEDKEEKMRSETWSPEDEERFQKEEGEDEAEEKPRRTLAERLTFKRKGEGDDVETNL